MKADRTHNPGVGTTEPLGKSEYHCCQWPILPSCTIDATLPVKTPSHFNVHTTCGHLWPPSLVRGAFPPWKRWTALLHTACLEMQSPDRPAGMPCRAVPVHVQHRRCPPQTPVRGSVQNLRGPLPPCGIRAALLQNMFGPNPCTVRWHALQSCACARSRGTADAAPQMPVWGSMQVARGAFARRENVDSFVAHHVVSPSPMHGVLASSAKLCLCMRSTAHAPPQMPKRGSGHNVLHVCKGSRET